MPKSFRFEENAPAYTIEESPENYFRLLAAARHAATQITKTPLEGLSGAALYIRNASQALLDAQPENDGRRQDNDGAIFKCLRRLVAVWPDIVAGTIEGEQVLSGDPGLWKRAMTEWPMGEFASMSANFMIERGVLNGRVLELGAGVGSCSRLVAPHATDGYIRTDLQPFLLKRQKIAGRVERYDFNEHGPWRDLDLIFAVNALHCAKDKIVTLRHLHEMLSPSGLLVLGEGQPVTDDRGTPWALNSFFGLFRGWWDIGGFMPRERWLAAMTMAGFSNSGFAVRRAGIHDLGGVIWAMK